MATYTKAGLRIAVIYWQDAVMHGHGQMDLDEAMKRRPVRGISAGLIIHEDREQITIATDFFPSDDPDTIPEDTFRQLSSYPKSGITRIRRTKIGRRA